MTQRRKRLIWLVGAVILLFIGIYFLNNSRKNNNEPKSSDSKKAVTINWQSKVSQIKKILKSSFPDIEEGEVSIEKQVDINGDGVPEVLVYIGTGGAYTVEETFFRIENDKPVLIKFKDAEGNIAPVAFSEGASVLNGVSLGIDSSNQEVYQGSYSVDESGTRLSECDVEAYKWNSVNGYFEYGKSLSQLLKKDFCEMKQKEVKSSSGRN